MINLLCFVLLGCFCHIGPGNRDDCRFQSDPRLPETMQPSGSAFKAESIIRGHMAVAGDLKISQVS